MLLNESGEPIYKVMIAVPCGDMVHAQFAQDLALLMGYTTFVRPQMEVSLYVLRGTYLPRARAALVNKAIETQATHIFWLDSDMRFPKDALIRLLLHDKHVVGVNYPTRIPPILPTAHDEQREPLWSSEGLVESSAAGMGCMLTRTEVFEKMGKPYFALGYSKDADDYSGEDYFFCQKARQSGFAIWIDGVMSEEVQHLGTFAFQMPHARMTLEAAKANGA